MGGFRPPVKLKMEIFGDPFPFGQHTRIVGAPVKVDCCLFVGGEPGGFLCGKFAQGGPP